MLVHRTLGLGLGLALAITGLSGSALVFRQEIDRALNPALLRTTAHDGRASLEAAIAQVERAYPGAAIARIRMPASADATLEFTLAGAPARQVYVDPRRGTILGARRETDALMGWLFQLHSHWLAGDRGEQVAGWLGVVLFAMGISGLVTWWPRPGGETRRGLRVRWSATPHRVRFDLHRAVGFWSSSFLVLAGLTGAALVFHDAARSTLAALLPGERAPTAVPVASSPASLPALGADSLLAIAERAQPGGTISYITLPHGTTGPFRVRRRLPGELHPNGRSMVSLDPRTGAVLERFDARAASLAARADYAGYPLHIGRVGGIATRVLALLVGLTPALLGITGWSMWRRRRRNARTGAATSFEVIGPPRIAPGIAPPAQPASASMRRLHRARGR